MQAPDVIKLQSLGINNLQGKRRSGAADNGIDDTN
jgi:hypothetical protein